MGSAKHYPKSSLGLFVFMSLCLFSIEARPEPKPEPKPPEYPLQAWMKANTAPAMAQADLAALAAALDTVARFAPKEYPNWASIARDGAAAARADKLDAVKATCRSCHLQYRPKYKNDMRTRPIP